MRSPTKLHGAGLGLRRDLIDDFMEFDGGEIDFFEVAPENWIGMDGRHKPKFLKLADRFPMSCHGLSLSLGGLAALDEDFVRSVGAFLRTHSVPIYSEHLSYCSDHAHLYDLAPLPFTEGAVQYVADRIKRVQDILGQQMAIENISFYAAPGKQMKELDFVCAVLDAADCGMLLDVNNVYVNSVNHKEYDPHDFINAIPQGRVWYYHLAGHRQESEDLIIDTHASSVIEPVWDLLKTAYARFGPLPTMLERDSNFPDMAELLAEIGRIREYQSLYAAEAASAA